LFIVSPPRFPRGSARHDVLDSGHDVGIGTATADIAAHQLANFIGGVRLVLGDQPGGGTDLAGGAVSALEGVMLDEGLLQGMKRASLRQAFDRRDLCAILHDREREARVDAPAVEQNGTGAALAVVAALFGPGNVEIEAQRVEQRGPWRDCQFALHAVDMKRDRRLGRHRMFFQSLASH
jgi:hypothetical protein